MFSEFFYTKGGRIEKGSVEVEIGRVISTDQRSDTRVVGGGSSYAYNGTGGGTSYVSSVVTVNRDVFYVRLDGSERHIRINFDCPIRAGHIVWLVKIKGSNHEELSLICVGNLRQWWFFKKHDAFARIFKDEIFHVVDEAGQLFANDELTDEAYSEVEQHLRERLAERRDACEEEAQKAAERAKERATRNKLLLGGLFVVLAVGGVVAFLKNQAKQAAYAEKVERDQAAYANFQTHLKEQAAQANRSKDAALAERARAEDQKRQAELLKFKPVLGRWVGSVACRGGDRSGEGIEIDVTFSMEGAIGQERSAMGQGQYKGRWGFDGARGLFEMSHPEFTSFSPTDLGRRYRVMPFGIRGQLDGEQMHVREWHPRAEECKGILRRITS